MTSLKLVVVDDNENFRKSLSELFRFTDDIHLLSVLADCSDLINTLTHNKPDVILMDIDMPGMNGIEATSLVKEIFPDIQVVMLTVSEEEDRIFQALRNGATGYLLKKSDSEEIVEAVRTVHQGGSPMTPAIARKMLHFFFPTGSVFSDTDKKAPEQSSQADDRWTSLTPREQEILEALVDGLSYKMIAAKHHISADTVKNHIQGIYRKLHVNSKGEAISYALKKGIAGNRHE